MHITLDRTPIKLLRLTDNEAASENLPPILIKAHETLHTTANAAARKAETILGDSALSAHGKHEKLIALGESTVAEISMLGAVADQVEAAVAEAEAAAVRAAIGRFDPSRLMTIASTIASRPREGRMSAAIRAKGNAETAAAILNAPRELGVLDDLDPRIADALRDQLLDAGLRQRRDAVKFAVARYRHSLTGACETLRRLTNTEEPALARIRRVG